MFGPKVALASAVILIVLICGAWFFAGTGTDNGFVQGVRESELCQTKPDHWWCQMWDGK